MVEHVEDTAGEKLTVDELRDAWPVLDTEERLSGFRLLARDEAEDFFLELSTRGQASVLCGMPSRERRAWLRLLPPDDVADLLAEFPVEERGELCSLLDDPTRREANALLAYAEDEAGGLMNPRFARVRPEMTVEEAIRYVRRQAQDKLETIYYTYVLDNEQRLLGVVSFRELLLAPGEKLVREVMHTEVITVPEEMDQEAVARIIAQHDILAVPVVDSERRVKGIITVDDVVDVVETEATEDIQKIGGSAALDAPYFQTTIPQMLKKRVGWLAVLFISEMFTSSTMGVYEDELKRAAVLMLFVPLIISSGGNSGSQATTLVIRAMALGHVKLRDWWRVVVREFLSGVGLGAILSVIGIARILLWQVLFHQMYGPYYFSLSLVIGISVVGVVTWGTLVGSALPLVIRALGFDPASASAPFVATLVDVTGIVIYLNVAQLMLAGKLL